MVVDVLMGQRYKIKPICRSNEQGNLKWPSAPLKKCGLIPVNIMAMISIAEEANNLERVLGNVADGIDKKVARQLDTMVRLIEPALLMVMGSAVLFVIVALLLPVFEMSTSMS